ncbi:MAG: hypothetical protein ACO3JU_11935, partial [Pseudohongiellaceae bacterium]
MVFVIYCPALKIIRRTRSPGPAKSRSQDRRSTVVACVRLLRVWPECLQITATAAWLSELGLTLD